MGNVANIKVKQRTVVEQVMEKIRDLIATGELKVGDKIKTEKELAESFGIGRSTVREAIKVFNYLGILESRTARGTYLCEQSGISSELINWIILLEAEHTKDLLALRDSLDLWIIRTLITGGRAIFQKFTEFVVKVGENTEAMLDFARNSEVEAFFQVKCNYHRILLSYSDNKIFSSLYSVLEKKLCESTKEFDKYNYSQLVEIVELQFEIKKAIESKDMSAVKLLYRKYSAKCLDLYQ